MRKLHADEADIDENLVRRLLAAQFPQWARLPVEEFPSSGTVNAVYRLGGHMSVRLPRVEWGVGDVEKEREWPARLAPLLPVPIPEVLGRGVPGEGYPWPWSVCRWLDGDNPVEGRLGDAGPLAKDLAEFVAAFRRVELPDGPAAYRGGPLETQDTATREAIGKLGGLIDTAAATAAWESALRAPAADRPVWVHADLMPGNLLVEDGRLTGVVDFATAGVGDPACDLIVAWNLLPATARDVFRDALGADDATWERGRGRALSMALIMLPYYLGTNPVIAANARHVIHEVITDLS
ncbi:Predicted kinase, aminoglycoside phosphotransferase (APT) family [Nonomuraea solani]|uniref:Predicted kinase, aminoglycoside phosphotransferase (APT) family n=1 Tax=Nonomuraea solani TaxID=1144553 RepID=A0A1H5YYC4_9ACTN|nr:aminoglycoside phosphotransferase family protein [Nonomuraea solani]SEG29061.1 Predicted kinase, aminoglycoside phosphotransferase (APT) family [Nonomuraea solani]